MKKPLIFKVPETVVNEETYQEYLVGDLGYETDEARAIAPGRLSGVAIPLVDNVALGGRVIGIVYCDSSDRAFFDDQEIVELCVLAAIAITDHIRIAA